MDSYTDSITQKDLFGSSVAIYGTSNSALAAWLYLKGYEILNIDSSNPRSKTIVFKRTPEIAKDVQLWNTGQAEGNCSLYESSRKSILHMINND